MKISAVPENWLERLALWLKIAPTPLSDTLLASLLSRTIVIATKLGIFEALSTVPLTANEVANRCATDSNATHILLNALVHLGYLKLRDNRYTLTRLSRKWILKDSAYSLYDKILWQFMEWEFMGQYENYIQTGEPVDYHANMNEDQWRAYQRGMRSMAAISAEEVGKRTPIPNGATHLLDIGGAHGSYSAAFCRTHSQLQATILELPEAIPHAQPILVQEGLGDRVTYRAGNALTDDLGKDEWDVVFISSVVHHFDEAENLKLTQKIAQALRPGGYFIVQDLIRAEKPKAGDHLGGLLNLYFAATSRAGTYSETEIHQWQQKAGLLSQPTVWLRSIPRHAQVVAKRL